MTTRHDIRVLADQHGWSELRRHSGDDYLSYYKWGQNNVRIELHILFDTYGRILTWTEWHNTRVNLDDQAGRRDRLATRLAE